MDQNLYNCLKYYLETHELPHWAPADIQQTILNIYQKYSLQPDNNITLKGSHRTLLSHYNYLHCFQFYHCHPMGGHFAFTNTFKKIAENYYWPKMKQDIQRDVESCLRCQAKGREIIQEPLHSIKVDPKPFNIISMDIKHVSWSRGNYRYIIVAIDYFTKWTEARALMIANSLEVSSFLYKEVICRHSTPAICITDNGSTFANELFDTVCKNFNIEHRKTSPFYASSNGLVERFNRTLGTGLRMLPPNEKGDWHLYLPAFLFSYRTMSQQSTKSTPFMMLYGRKARTPFDNYMLGKTDVQKLTKTEWETAVAEAFIKITNHLKQTHDEAGHFIIKAQKTQESYVERRFLQDKYKNNKPPFQLGDLVMKYHDAFANDLSKKLEDRFVGPYIVHKINPNSTYLLKSQDGKVNKNVTHGNKLKIYKSPKIFFNHPSSSNIYFQFQNEQQQQQQQQPSQVPPRRSQRKSNF